MPFQKEIVAWALHMFLKTNPLPIADSTNLLRELLKSQNAKIKLNCPNSCLDGPNPHQLGGTLRIAIHSQKTEDLKIQEQTALISFSLISHQQTITNRVLSAKAKKSPFLKSSYAMLNKNPHPTLMT